MWARFLNVTYVLVALVLSVAAMSVRAQTSGLSETARAPTSASLAPLTGVANNGKAPSVLCLPSYLARAIVPGAKSSIHRGKLKRGGKACERF